MLGPTPHRPDTTPARSTTLRGLLVVAVAAVALILQACGSASAGAAVKDRFFGMHGADPSLFPQAVGAVDLTSNGVYWPDLQTSATTWSWDHLDTLVDQARSNGAQPLLVLGQTPAWTKSGGAATSSVPDMDKWKAYVRAVVHRYGTRLDYEIWPEPNITSNWSGSPKALAKLVAAASTVIHRAQPHAVVVSPAMVLRLKFERIFMDKFFAQKVGGFGMGHYIDAVGIDAYPVQTGSPEDSMKLVGQARAILRSHKVSDPLWNVEINYGVAGGGQTIAHHSSASKQASYVVRTYVLNAAAHVQRVYWLGWGTYPTMDVALADASGSPTKAGTAYSVVASWLRGQRPGACQRTSSKHLYTCKLVRSGSTSWVYWTTKGKTVVHAPRGSRHVQTMLGAVSGTRAGKAVTVTSAPVRIYH